MRRVAAWSAKTTAAALAFGGALLSGIPDDAQAQWTGVWTLRKVAQAPSQQPSNRSWTEMIFDPVAGKPVLFGGSGGTYRNDILQLDLPGLRWVDVELFVDNSNVTPYGPPCGRDEVTFTYDPVNALYWIFGGSGFVCGSRTSTTGSGTTSIQIVDATLPSGVVDFYKDYFLTVTGGVTYRAYVTAYDPVTKTLTLTPPIAALKPGMSYQIRSQPGGGAWNYSPATRLWHGFDAPSFGYTGPMPVSRLSPTVAYSDADQALVMFGGAVFNDTWALDVKTQTWIQMIPDGRTTSPPRRAQLINSMAYDPVNDLFVLFGGRCGDTNCAGVPYNKPLGDTWTYRLSTNTWTQVHPPASPAPRFQHTLTYDPVNRVMVLFGGRDGGTNFYGDTWVYDVVANTWTEVATSGDVPSPRYLQMMVYDPSSGAHVIYGGALPSGAGLGSVHSLQLAPAGGDLPPVASFTVTPSAPTVGVPASFDGTASRDFDGSIVSYAWDFGDGTNATGATASHTYSAIATYLVSLTVMDDAGVTGTATRSVTVGSATPAPDILYSRTVNGQITNGGSVTSVVAAGAAVPYTNLAGGAYQFTLTTSVPSSVSVTITATGSGGITVETIVVSVP